MKKISTIFTIICALFVGSLATNAQNLIGEWNATSVIVSEESGVKTTLSVESIQKSLRIIFLKNNQIVLLLDGEPQQGTYQLEDNMLSVELDGQILPFPVTFIDEYTFEMDWSARIKRNAKFVLEKTTKPSTSQPEVKEYTGPINLLGSWIGVEVLVDINGDGHLEKFDFNMMDQLEVSADIKVLENNKLVITFNGKSEYCSYRLYPNELIVTDSSDETVAIPIKFLSADKFEMDVMDLIGDGPTLKYIYVRQ